MFISLLANHRCRCTHHMHGIALLLWLAMCNARQPAVEFKFERCTSAACTTGTATPSMPVAADSTAAARSNDDQTTSILTKNDVPKASTSSSRLARSRLGTRAAVTFVDGCGVCCMGYSYQLWRRRSGLMSPLKATTVESSNYESKRVTCLLQSICDKILAAADLRDVESLVAEVEGPMFPQADAWGKTWAPVRSMIAQVPDSFAVSVLALPRELSRVSLLRVDVHLVICSICGSACFSYVVSCSMFCLPPLRTFYKNESDK